LDGLLQGAGIEVSEMRREHGQMAAQLAQGNPNWKAKWRDYMIAAHAAQRPYRLVTINVTDFQCLGDRVFRPIEFQDGIADGSIR
jgi:predicted nucleic acid-binding protein